MAHLFIDPGVRACGAAIFSEAGELIAAGFPRGTEATNTNRYTERAPTWTTMARAVRHWATEASPYAIKSLTIELPQVYDRKHQVGSKKNSDPNDLIQLAATVGAISLEFAGVPTTVYLPCEWKGQVPKIIHHKRAMARLTPAEAARIPKLAASSLHNVVDAVALGLTACGRLKGA